MNENINSFKIYKLGRQTLQMNIVFYQTNIMLHCENNPLNSSSHKLVLTLNYVRCTKPLNQQSNGLCLATALDCLNATAQLYGPQGQRNFKNNVTKLIKV